MKRISVVLSFRLVRAFTEAGCSEALLKECEMAVEKGLYVKKDKQAEGRGRSAGQLWEDGSAFFWQKMKRFHMFLIARSCP